MHCSLVFRSSVPSDLLSPSPGRCPSGVAQGECGSTRSMEWGVGPGGRVSHREGALPGPVRSQGWVARCVIQNWSHVLSVLVVHGRGRQSPDQARDLAAELAGWTSGELPGQVTEQLVSWPPGSHGRPACRQPRISRQSAPNVAAQLPRVYCIHLIGGFTAAS